MCALFSDKTTTLKNRCGPKVVCCRDLDYASVRIGKDLNYANEYKIKVNSII